MSKLPQLNLRIAEAHQPLIRQIAHILRESHGDAFAADLNAWLNDRPAPMADSDLAERVAALEEKIVTLATGHAGAISALQVRLEALEKPAHATKRLVRKKAP